MTPLILVAAPCLGTCGHAPSSTPVANRCSQIDRGNQQVLAALVGGNAAIEDAKRALSAALRCAETPHGAWGLAMGSLTTTGDAIGGRWSLVHIGSAGEIVSVSPDTTLAVGGGGDDPVTRHQNLAWSEAMRIIPLAPVLFDFDGDGEPEAVVVVRTALSNESGIPFHVLRGRVWTMREGTVALYRPARDFVVEEIRDVDGDGRPDIICHGPYADLTTVQCGSEEPYPVYGPALLAHSVRDGTFSWADAQAIVFAKRECPASPNPVIVPGFRPEMVDFPRSAKNVACARLWGADEQTLRAEIAMRCYAVNENCVTCDDRALLERWAGMRPPFRLPTSQAPSSL